MAGSKIGAQAEEAVAVLLSEQGFEIGNRNWTTPVCEIDIIAKRKDTVYLIEVKYRSASAQGSGFEYIGHRKLKQMEYAASVWAKDSGWNGDIRLMAAEVSGPKFENISIVEI